MIRHLHNVSVTYSPTPPTPRRHSTPPVTRPPIPESRVRFSVSSETNPRSSLRLNTNTREGVRVSVATGEGEECQPAPRVQPTTPSTLSLDGRVSGVGSTHGYRRDGESRCLYDWTSGVTTESGVELE